MRAKLSVLFIALCLLLVGCGQTRYSAEELGYPEIPAFIEPSRRDYDAESTVFLNKYPWWGANRIENGVLVRPKSFKHTTHPRPVENDTDFFDSGKFGTHPSRGDPGRNTSTGCRISVRGHMSRNPGGNGNHWVRPYTRRR